MNLIGMAMKQLMFDEVTHFIVKDSIYILYGRTLHHPRILFS